MNAQERYEGALRSGDRERIELAARDLAEHDFLLTVPEVCARLRISRATLYRQIARDDLVVTKIGNRTLFRLTDVRDFVAERQSA